MDNNFTRTLNNFETLNMPEFRANIERYISYVESGEKTMVDALYELTELEMELRTKRAMNACVKVANFPYIKRLSDFDFSFQPSINKDQIMNFKYLQFLEKKENIIFIGSPGVGKTHLATAIGIENAKTYKSTYFMNCNDLIESLKKAYSQNRLNDKLRTLSKYKLLIIDEVGYLPIDVEGANLLFQLINRRYEKNSTIITTNKPFSKWGELFGDNTIANAILDRLIHHSHVININGRSYRMKDVLIETDKKD